MVPFIVTLLVLSTLNVDAQIGFATFKDEDDLSFGEVVFSHELDDGLPYASVMVNWMNTDGSEFANRTHEYRMFIFASRDCGGFPYSNKRFNSGTCPTGELDCKAREYDGQGLFKDLNQRKFFDLEHIAVEEILTFSLAIVVGPQTLYCANINQYLEAVAGSDDDLGFRFIMTSGADGIVEIMAGWNSEADKVVSRIEIHESPVIDGDCSTTGDIFNREDGISRPCAHGDITCELEIAVGDPFISGELDYLMFDHLFCHAERSVVVVFDGETEPNVCYNFNLTEGAVAGCPSPSPSKSGDRKSVV